MNNDERFTELWNDYLEGEIGDSGIAELKELFASDPALLDIATETYQTHRLLGMIAEDSPSRHDQFVSETMERVSMSRCCELSGIRRVLPKEPRFGERTRFAHAVGLLSAAAIALIIVGLAVFRSGTEPVMAEIVAADGIVLWTDPDGAVIRDPDVGSSIGGGTLESLSADSLGLIKFHDDSELTILGRAAVTISARRQKELHLHEGRLLGYVTPQPEELPILIHTPTAKLESQGTKFDVDVELSTTVLIVYDGNVRVTRLADGSISNVSDGHQVTVAANPQDELKAVPRRKEVNYWKSVLLAEDSDGIWVNDPNEGHARLKAIPMLKTHVVEEGKGLETFYSCSFSVSRGESSPVVIDDDVKIRIRGRANGDIQFGLTTKHINGGLAGKYVSGLYPNRAGMSEQDFDIEISIDKFKSDGADAPESPVGTELVEWWCFSKDHNADLSITSVELIPTGDSKT